MREKSDFFKQGTYDGNSVDETVITGVGFKPSFAIVKNGTNATANNTYAFLNMNYSEGNSSSYFSATANLVNMIKTLETDGFKLGTDVKVNASSNSYYYLAFVNSSPPSASGTFRMAEGTYTGDGGYKEISNIGFKPDLVIIKDNSDQFAMFRTRLMGGNSTGYFASATANILEAIISIQDNGFILGGDQRVNRSGNTYHWQAFGNAFDPIDNSGAADFAIGAYYGSGTDDRNISNLPFQPDLVVVKSFTNAGSGVLRTSEHSGDNTSYFLGTADAANFIQNINTDGFQIGTGVTVNTSAVVYFWFAFKTGDNLKIGSYTGNATARDIFIQDNFRPDLVWTKTNTAVGGIMKPSTLADPASQYFLGTANANTQITAIRDDGFSVGTSTGANASGAAVRYVAWKIPLYLISITLSDGEVEYGALQAFASKTTLPADMPPDGDKQTVTNLGDNPVNINIKGQNSISECTWLLSSTNGTNQYKHQFCDASGTNCSNPPTNYNDLTTAYTRLFSNLTKNESRDFHLRIVMPSSSSCNDTQVVNVTVQATEI